mgnify:CR=1 FL=1
MDYFAVIKDLGLPLGFLVIAVYAFASGKVVPRWLYDAKVADCERWQSVAERAANALERAGEVADKAVAKVVDR